jgi:hypothetical protein
MAFHLGANLIEKQERYEIVRTTLKIYIRMKRTCHGNKIYGGGTKAM